MAEVNVTWNGPAILAGIETAVAGAMAEAGRALAASTVSAISTPYPPASRPGQPPHRRSGGLTRAVGSRVARAGRSITMSVGVPASSPVRRQAEALQGGTSRMAARPFVPTAEVALPLVLDEVGSAVRSAMGRR